jgi:hypothetical protein
MHRALHTQVLDVPQRCLSQDTLNPARERSLARGDGLCRRVERETTREMHTGPSFEWAEIFPIVDARVESEVCPLFFSLGTADRLSAVFETAGLINVVTERLEIRLEWASAEEACGAAFVGGPVALAYSRFDDERNTARRTQRVSRIHRVLAE